METITEKQAKSIAYHLQSMGAPFQKGALSAINSLDRSSASDIIGMFKKGQNDIAHKQLKHLFPNCF